LRVDRSKGKSGAQAGGFLGDIAIAPETARRYAKKNDRTLDNEIRILMLHGILHLMGYDHESKSDYGQMNRIEQKLRRRLGLA
jgi:probable rRNA maturation factor